MSSQIPHSFLNWVICLFILSSNLYVLCIFILDIRSLSDVWFADVFSHSVGFLFILLTVSFDTQKFSIWIKSNLSFFFSFLLEWASISCSRGSSGLRDQTCVSCTGRWVLYHGATREALYVCFVWPCCAACRILVPWLGVGHKPSVVKVWNPNCWTIRELPPFSLVAWAFGVTSKKVLSNPWS